MHACVHACILHYTTIPSSGPSHRHAQSGFSGRAPLTEGLTGHPPEHAALIFGGSAWLCCLGLSSAFSSSSSSSLSSPGSWCAQHVRCPQSLRAGCCRWRRPGVQLRHRRHCCWRAPRYCPSQRPPPHGLQQRQHRLGFQHCCHYRQRALHVHCPQLFRVGCIRRCRP